MSPLQRQFQVVHGLACPTEAACVMLSSGRGFRAALGYGKAGEEHFHCWTEPRQGKHWEQVWFMSLLLFQGPLGLFLYCISQAMVMTVYIALLSTLSRTLIKLVRTVVHQHHLWAGFSTQPPRGTLFCHPHNNPERLTCYPWGNWSSGRLRSLFKTLSSSGSKAVIQIHLVWPRIWATLKTQLGFQNHG